MKSNQLQACLNAWRRIDALKKSYPGVDWDVKAKQIFVNLRRLAIYAHVSTSEHNKLLKDQEDNPPSHFLLVYIPLCTLVGGVSWLYVCRDYGGCNPDGIARGGPLIIDHSKAMFAHAALFAFAALVIASIYCCFKISNAIKVHDRPQTITTLINDLLKQKEYHLFKDFARYVEQQNLGSVGRIVGEYTYYSRIVSQLELRCDIDVANKIQSQLYNAIYQIEAMCYFNGSQSDKLPFAAAWLPPEVWKLIMNQILAHVESVFPDISLNSKIYLASLIRANHADPIKALSL